MRVGEEIEGLMLDSEKGVFLGVFQQIVFLFYHENFYFKMLKLVYYVYFLNPFEYEKNCLKFSIL